MSAVIYFRSVIDEYPGSKAAEKAEKELEKIRPAATIKKEIDETEPETSDEKEDEFEVVPDSEEADE